VTAESLFCILNGDDLYSTFEGIEVRFILSNTVRIFSKFYLCLFIFLFIYVVLSLFIGIFNHAYESLSVSLYSTHNMHFIYIKCSCVRVCDLNMFHIQFNLKLICKVATFLTG